MKPSYPSWDELKKDAHANKATDIFKEKGIATISFSEGTEPLKYKKVGEGWEQHHEPRQVRRFN